MQKIPIVLAVWPRMFRDALQALIDSEPDLEIVDDVLDPVDLLLAVKESGAQVVVMTVPISDETPPVCTHLLAEFPDLTVIGICPEAQTAVTYRNAIDIGLLGALSIQEVVAAIRRAPCGL